MSSAIRGARSGRLTKQLARSVILLDPSHESDLTIVSVTLLQPRHDMAAVHRPRVFLDTNVGEQPAGRLTIELFADKTPRTCEK